MANNVRAVREPQAEDIAAATSTSLPALRPRRFRRWLQFSMRTVLLLTAAAAVLISVVGVPLFRLRKQQLAVKRLEQAGARLTFEAQGAEGIATWAGEKLFGEEAATRVTKLAWNDEPASAADLAPLESLIWIEHVDLAWKAVDDEGVSHLRQLRHLATLNLNGARLTDRGLAYLAECRALRRLQLHGASVTDAGLASLAKLSELEGIDLSSTQVTGENLEPLARLPALDMLNLNETPLNDSAVTVLSRMKRLRWLGVSHTTGLTDAAREALAAALPDTAIDD